MAARNDPFDPSSTAKSGWPMRETTEAPMPPPTADLMALVREIAADDDPTYEDGGDSDHSGVAHCRYCDARIWGGEKHSADCHWVQARALVARLEGKEPE